MKRFSLRAAALAFWMIGGFSPLYASQNSIYRLSTESWFERGCFPPCTCPVMESRPVVGTFELAANGSDGQFDNYKVRKVNWSVWVSDQEIRISGSGTLKVEIDSPQTQQLDLELRVGNQSPRHFHSGLVSGNVAFPNVDLAISINGFYCLDTGIKIEAQRVPMDQITWYDLREGSTYESGCVPPCYCPISLPSAVTGRFGLVRLNVTPLFTNYAVVDVNWLVRDSSDALGAGFPIRGQGMYRVGGEVALQHQIELDLSVNGKDPVQFNSGLVLSRSPFPAIDIVAKMRSHGCFGQTLKLHSQPAPMVSLAEGSAP